MNRLLTLLILLLPVAAPHAAEYTYDKLHRLTSVIHAGYGIEEVLS